MHLSGRMPDRTVLLLTGMALYSVAAACRMARTLAPAMIVLEDVDLVAEDRDLYDGSQPILFQLLNEMDGLAEDADVVFVLTTNRLEVLEQALAARPGRVDEAVELPLPDAEGRRRLLSLYSEGLDVRAGDMTRVVEQTEGLSPAFIRELVRRAALIAAEEGDGALVVAERHLTTALEELRSSTDQVTRALLGADDDLDVY
jgi:ATP-dependent 26S proteasome regulatory subunit